MIASIENANFPVDSEKRTYHVGTKAGETANRIITVGDLQRARKIGTLLDKDKVKVEILSKRGFLTITGYFKGEKVSIVAIGMVSSFLIRAHLWLI